MSSAMDLHKPLRQAFLDAMREYRVTEMEAVQRLESHYAKDAGERASLAQALVLDQYLLLSVCNVLHEAGYTLVKET
jgi:hypothetical protein